MRDTQGKVDDWTKDDSAPIGHRRHRAPPSHARAAQGGIELDSLPSLRAPRRHQRLD